ncbi:MAG: glycosyltransferase [Chakrabartia sp.]
MISPRPRVSVIIPHLNQQQAAARCLASIKAQRYPAERVDIILADNGSAQPLDAIRRAFPDVHIVEERTPGPGPARNRGVAMAQGEILAFVDADCRAHPDWLAAAVAALEKPDATGVVGGDVRIDLADPNHLTGFEAYESVFAYRQQMYIEKLHFSGTGNLAMRRAVYEAVGPFAGIGVAEDRDWGRRARARGYAARYVPGMIVYHPARTDMADMAAKWRRQTAHDLADHRARQRGALIWAGRIAAILGITPLHALRILASRRVPGWAAKARGIATLAAIRHIRAREMLRQWRAGSPNGAVGWNRQN